jgi:hypothetical protein
MEKFVNALDYTQIGAWEITGSATDGSDTLTFVNYAWWAKAQITPGDAMNGLKSLGSVKYSGLARGTFYQDGSSAETVLMSGDFNMTVDFSSPSITDFDWSVSNGSHSASITDAKGSFFNGSEYFIDKGTGTWLIGSSTPSYRESFGTLAGPSAEEAAGVVIMKNPGGANPNEGVSGAYNGKR